MVGSLEVEGIEAVALAGDLADGDDREELAAVFAFLCSDAASFVSGVDWLVDGGATHQVIGPTP